MGRCYLKGRLGDQLNALGSALGFNFRKLLAGIKADAACAAIAACLDTPTAPQTASYRRQPMMIAA